MGISLETVLQTVGILIGGLIGIPVYFFPTILAYQRDHPRAAWVLAANLLVPVVAWVFGLGMLISGPRRGAVSVADAGAGTSQCPHCGAHFEPADYRVEAPVWLCGRCRGDLRTSVQSRARV